MPPKHTLTDQEKLQIIALRAQGGGAKVIGRQLSLSRETVRSFLKRVSANPLSFVNKKSPGRPAKYSAAVGDAAATLARENNTLTENQIADRLGNDAALALPSPPSQQSISNFLLARKITYKHVTNVPDERNNADVKQRRATYVNVFAEPVLTIENSVFLDESPFSAAMRRTQGHSPAGQPAIAHVPQLRCCNVSVIAAITPKEGLLLHQTKVTKALPKDGNVLNNAEDEVLASLKDTKGVGTKDFLRFIRHLLAVPALRDGPPRYFVMDNVNFHKSVSVTNAIQSAGHSVHFLPPYSPFLNPIEQMFSCWKAGFKKAEANSNEEVVAAINESASAVTPLACRRA